MSKENERKKSYCRDDYGLSPEYERKTYQAKKKMDAYKEKEFDRKKVVKDEYSDNTLHRSHKAAKNKYGNNKDENNKTMYAKHAAETDHVLSLKRGHERHKKNPFIKDQDLKDAYNRDVNFSMTSKTENASKGEKSNIKVVMKDKDGRLAPKHKVKMVKDQMKATAITEAELTGKTAKNMGEVYYNGAKDSVTNRFKVDYKEKADTYQVIAQLTPMAISTMKSVSEVVNGDKELQEVVADSAKSIGKTAMDGGLRELATVGTRNLKATQILAKSGLPIQMAEVVFILKDNLIMYANGELDEAQFAQQVQRDTVKAVVGAIAYGAGEALPIPIPVVMGMLTSMVAVEACNLVYQMVDEIKAIDAYKDEIKRFEHLAREAKQMMDVQREELIENARLYFDEFDATIETSFRILMNGISTDSADELTSGLDHLLHFFGEQVQFQTYEEFDDFFMDEDSVLKL